MAKSSPSTSFSRTGSSTVTAHRIPIIFGLVSAFASLLALRNPKIRESLGASLKRTKLRLMIKKCDGFCGTEGYHTHDLRILGKWNYIWKYKFLDRVTGDPRPTPPVGDNGSAWFAEYEKAWLAEYPGHTISSCWVRDEKGFWVWVTDTPLFDRKWFDDKGWRFPIAWITSPSKKFYQIGKDQISSIVSLPTDGKSNVPVEGETW